MLGSLTLDGYYAFGVDNGNDDESIFSAEETADADESTKSCRSVLCCRSSIFVADDSPPSPQNPQHPGFLALLLLLHAVHQQSSLCCLSVLVGSTDNDDDGLCWHSIVFGCTGGGSFFFFFDKDDQDITRTQQHPAANKLAWCSH